MLMFLKANIIFLMVIGWISFWVLNTLGLL